MTKTERKRIARDLSADVAALVRDLDEALSMSETAVDIRKLAAILPRIRPIRARIDALELSR